MTVKDAVCDSLYDDLLGIARLEIFENIKESSFLITGGSGFIAYYIVMALLCLNDERENNNRVAILIRSEDKARKKYGKLLERDDFKVIVQDVCSPMNDVESFDYVIHAASAASAEQFEKNPIGVFNSNVIGTENVIDFVRAKLCKSMVYVSSFTVYGNGTDQVSTVDESFRGPDDWSTNRSCYSLGKRSGEFLCMAAVRKYGCPIRIVRPGFVYGASTPEDNRVYSQIIRNVAECEPIVLQSAGLLFRSMAYVTDVVRGIFYALLRGKEGEAYNIANEFASIRGFAEAGVIAANCENVKLCFINETDRDAAASVRSGGAMSIEKLKSCGWKPAVELEKGIKMAAEIYASLYGRK